MKSIDNNKHPLLILLSSPSGGGKTTLCRMLLQDFPDMFYSISCTTRDARSGEVDGKHYFFLSEEEFKTRIEQGFFIEYARVHNHWYGTPAEPIYKNLALGKDVLLQIDVQGADRIRNFLKSSSASSISFQQFVDIFIMPPSIEEIKVRLEKRGEDSRETIEKRLLNARHEMEQWDKYKYVVMNDDLMLAYQRLKAIITAEHCRVIKRDERNE